MVPKLLLTPVVVIVIAGLLIGAFEPFGQPLADCGDQCYDIVLGMQDEFACTGDIQPTGRFWGEQLEKCRARLRREGRPVAG